MFSYKEICYVSFKVKQELVMLFQEGENDVVIAGVYRHYKNWIYR